MLDSLEKMRVHLPPADAGQLKRFAVLTMLIDHITYVFLEYTWLSDGRTLRSLLPMGDLLDSLGRAVGRQAFPIFCFLLVESFICTHERPYSRLKYLVRIAVFAALSQIPFQQAFFSRSRIFHANVLVTLGLGLLAIWVLEELGNIFLRGDPLWDESKEKRKKEKDREFSEKEEADESKDGKDSGEDIRLDADGTICLEHPFFSPDRRLFGVFVWLFAGSSTVYGFCRLADTLHSDYSHAGIMVIVLMYVLRRYRILSLGASLAVLTWYKRSEIYSLPAFFFLACYNGKRGKQNKYFYYFFYPAHILVLWLVRRYFFGY